MSQARRGSERDGAVRTIELTRRADAPGARGKVSRYVGRVGALAVALGVGSLVGSLPVAFADTSGSAGATRQADSSASEGGSAKVSTSRGSR